MNSKKSPKEKITRVLVFGIGAMFLYSIGYGVALLSTALFMGDFSRAQAIDRGHSVVEKIFISVLVLFFILLFGWLAKYLFNLLLRGKELFGDDLFEKW